MNQHNRKNNLIIIPYIMICIFPYSPPTNAECFRTGVPITDISPMFINQFKSATRFRPHADKGPRDAQGYPLEVPFVMVGDKDTAKEVIYIIKNAGSPKLLDDSIYVLLWDGNGEIEIDSWYAEQISSANCQNENPFHQSCYPVRSDSGRIEFRVKYAPNSAWRQIQIKILRSGKGNHVRNIRLYLKSFEDEYESDMKVFNPVYLERIKPFHTLKFVDPFRINNSRFRTWEDRTPKDYFNQNEGPHDCGLAYEWAIELCNLSKNHLWFNVPHAADNDALRKMAELVYERLDPNLMVYLEYSNETWNWSWQLRDQYEWVRANGGWVTGHVNSSKNVFTIWQDVFGDQSHRIKRVMATWPYKTRRLEECTTEDYDIVSGTYYWNASGERRDTWDANTTVDQMLQDIQANIRGDWYEKKKEYADKVHAFGKELYCYAGGLGGDQRDTLDGTSSGYPYWRNFQKLQKDPRLLPIIHEVVDSLTSLGYSGGIEHSLIGNWDYNPCCKRISFWGLMNSLYGDAENYPKYMGMIDKLQDCEQHVHSADRNVSLSKEKSILPMAQSKRVPGGIQYRVPQKDNWELSVFTADGRRIANICSYGNKSSTVTTTLHPGLNIIRFRINGKIVDVQKVTLHWAQ